ncbi:MAG: hypothetical protein WA901_09205 [Phormidesmis sp.]
MTDVLAKNKPRKMNRQWNISGLNYLFMGILLNAIVWGGTLLYLKRAEPSYVSRWGVLVLDGDSSVNVSLPGSASASTDTGRSNENARSDYVYIATSEGVIEEAARQAGIESDEFGDPDITVDSDTAIMSFAVEANTPELAYTKANALYEALNARVEQLRDLEISRRTQEDEVALQRARQRIDAAQDKLANYLATSEFNSDEQLQGLANGIESLRQLSSEYAVQADGLSGRITQLNDDVDLSSQDVTDSYSLQGDPVYQQQFAAYGRLSAEFSELSGQLGSQHPLVVAKRAELESAQSALEERGTFLLGRPVDQSTLVRIAPLGIDPQVAVVRGDLFRETVVDQAERERLISQNQSLGEEISQMEARLDQLSQDKFTVDRLRRDFQLAETIFASTVARLDLSEDDIYSIYPPIQLFTEPTVPNEDDRTNPSSQTIFLAGLAGSFVVTFGLLLLWYENRDRYPSETLATNSDSL